MNVEQNIYPYLIITTCSRSHKMFKDLSSEAKNKQTFKNISRNPNGKTESFGKMFEIILMKIILAKVEELIEHESGNTSVNKISLKLFTYVIQHRRWLFGNS